MKAEYGRRTCFAGGAKTKAGKIGCGGWIVIAFFCVVLLGIIGRTAREDEDRKAPAPTRENQREEERAERPRIEPEHQRPEKKPEAEAEQAEGEAERAEEPVAEAPALQKGMTPDEVKAIWGEPQRHLSAGDVLVWRFADGGRVTFKGGLVTDWKEVPQTLVSGPALEQPADEEAKPRQEGYGEGDTVHVGYTSYAVWRSWWSNRLTADPYLDQRPNAAYLFVELTVRNNDRRARTIPIFHLVDEGGAEYESSPHSWILENSIGALDSLNPSVRKQGVVVFDVPRGRQYRLKLSGGYWSREVAYVRLSPRADR